MKKTIGIVALVACAGIASASTVTPGTSIGSVTFTNVSSDGPIGTATNSTGSWVATGSGIVGSVQITGSLTEVNTGTYASEARVNIVNSANGNTGVLQASTTSGFTGTLAIGPVTKNWYSGGPLNVTAGDVLNFEWFESYNDSGLDATWDTVTYDFQTAATLNNGSAAFGSLAQGAKTFYSGSHVSGGLDFFTFSIADAVDGGGFLDISMTAGLTGVSMTDTEIALYDGAGNKVAENDDIVSGNLFSGLNLTSLAAGDYTLVTGGYNTVFPATLGGTFTPGTNAGTYELSITYVPTPGALALLGMGGLIANRRRR